MGRDATSETFINALLGKALRRKPSDEPKPLYTPLAMLERLYGDEHPDYCLYLKPAAGDGARAEGLLSVDLQSLLIAAFHPLPVVTLDETGKSAAGSALPDEAFLMLANRARVLALVPTAEAHFIDRLRLIQSKGPIGRCILIMPEAGTLGEIDWPNAWPAAREAAMGVGIELSGYTRGGWLFRLGKDGKACTFRPIVNPNPEKIARALEAICGEME